MKEFIIIIDINIRIKNNNEILLLNNFLLIKFIYENFIKNILKKDINLI